MALLYTIDDYDVKEYRNFPILLVATIIFLTICYFMGGWLYSVELGHPDNNLAKLEDAQWLTYMAASTIGFGDHYPVTTIGRVIVGSMFLLGAVFLGIIIGLVHNMVMGFMDTSVKNRELRKQMQDLIDHNEQVEQLVSHLSGQLHESHNMNEAMYDHNKKIEDKLDILMKHVDETTPELKMENVHENT